MNQQEMEAAAAAAAQQNGLDPKVVHALIAQESSWNPWAWNPEPRYRFLWNVRTNQPFRKQTPEEIASEIPPADFPFLMGDRDQEWWAQQASWGLMQIMGATARECGFRGGYLPMLLDPLVNLRYGCLYLRRKLNQAGNIREALLNWNGGGDPAYPEKVLGRLA